MAVMRSRLRAHAVEWHVAPAAHIDSRHRADFLDLQRRCNNEFCRHTALIHNFWLEQLESVMPSLENLLCTLQQMAIFLRQLALAREQHTLSLSEGKPLQESDCGTAVVICFDENGVPWCPPLPGAGLGDPYILSERLHSWWSAWQRAAPETPQGWCLQQSGTATRQLCDVIEQDYNSSELSASLGTMLAVENSMSTDFWQRLGQGLRRCCEETGMSFPDAGFFPVAETHARLQARHSLYLMEAASVHDLLDDRVFFQAGMTMLERLDQFWKTQGETLLVSH